MQRGCGQCKSSAYEVEAARLIPLMGQLAVLTGGAARCAPDPAWLLWQPAGVEDQQKCANLPVDIRCLLTCGPLMTLLSCGLEDLSTWGKLGICKAVAKNTVSCLLELAF